MRQVENKKSNRSEGKAQKTEDLKSKSDSVTITMRSEEARKAKEVYDKLPEIRQDLVDDLKERVKSGDYEVSSKEIADKIVHRMVVDEIV